MRRLYTPEALALQQAMSEAHQALEAAYANYQDAMATARAVYESGPPDADSDIVFQVRRQGRVYAEVLTHYSQAVMSWLIYVEKHVHPAEHGAGSA